MAEPRIPGLPRTASDPTANESVQPFFLPNIHPHLLLFIPVDSVWNYDARFINGFKCDACLKTSKPNARRACIECSFNLCIGCFRRLVTMHAQDERKNFKPVPLPSLPSTPPVPVKLPNSSPRTDKDWTTRNRGGSGSPTSSPRNRGQSEPQQRGIQMIENPQFLGNPHTYNPQSISPSHYNNQTPPYYPSVPPPYHGVSHHGNSPNGYEGRSGSVSHKGSSPENTPSSQRAGFRPNKVFNKTKDNPSPRAQIKRVPTKPKVQDFYDFGRVLGSGGFSVVRLAIEKKTKQQYAIKQISKDSCNMKQLDSLYQEIEIMKKLDHPHIVKFFEMFENEKTIFIVLEFLSGGELFDQLVARGSYSEAHASNIVKQVLFAVQYMHSLGIAHRDLKPENLLCESPECDIIKVSDFGLSKDFFQYRMKTNCGTPDYVAPEILQRTSKDNSYGAAVDIWSIGIITYILVCGFPPFYGDDEQEIFHQILRCEYQFCSPEWDECSDLVMDFISSLLVLDPAVRPSAAELLRNPWIQQAPKHSFSTRRIDSFKKEMNDWNSKRKTRDVGTL